MVGTAVELEGVTINVLVLNPEKIVKCNLLRRKPYNTGETGLLNSLSGKASNVNIVSSSGDPVQVPMYKLEDKHHYGNTQPCM
jgi:hypothetical protein